MGRGKEQEKCFTLEGAPRRASTQESEPEQEQTVCQKPVYTTSAGQMERQILPVNIAKTRFSTKIHFVSSLSPLGEQLKLSFPHHEYLLLFAFVSMQPELCHSSPTTPKCFFPNAVRNAHARVPEFPAFLGCSSEHPNTNTALLRGFHHPVNQKRKVPSNMKWRKIHLLPRRKCRGQLKAEP